MDLAVLGPVTSSPSGLGEWGHLPGLPVKVTHWVFRRTQSFWCFCPNERGPELLTCVSETLLAARRYHPLGAWPGCQNLHPGASLSQETLPIHVGPALPSMEGSQRSVPCCLAPAADSLPRAEYRRPRAEMRAEAGCLF